MQRTGFRLIAAVSLAIAAAPLYGQVTFSGSDVTATHPAAVWALAALNSGKVFDVANYADPPTGDVTKFHAAMGKMLKALRAALPEKPKFQLDTGKDLHGVGPRPSIVPMKGETTDHFSTFAFRSGPSHVVYVIFKTADKAGTPSAIHLLLWPEGKVWKIADIGLFATRIGRYDFAAAMKAAQDEVKANRAFNAMALYTVAYELAKAPPYRMTGQMHQLRPEMSVLTRQMQIGTKPFDTLEVGATKLPVLHVRAFPKHGKLYLGVGVPVATMLDEPQAADRHLAIARALLARHPQLAQFFDGIGVATRPADAKPPVKGRATTHTMAEIRGEAEAKSGK